MDFLIGREVGDGEIRYIIEEKIGNWGSEYQYPVHRAVPFPQDPDRLPTAMKIMRRVDEIQWNLVNAEVANSDAFFPNGHIFLSPERTFCNTVDNIETLFISVPSMNLRNIRSCLVNEFSEGLPIGCVALVLEVAINSVMQLHNLDVGHENFTAGTIFFAPGQRVQLAFGPTSFEHDIDRGLPDLLALNTIPQWAGPDEAPDMVENPHVKLDIWLLGVLALELAYGTVQVSNREEFLAIINYIRNHSGLPKTWRQLRHTATHNAISPFLAVGNGPSFCSAFISFIKGCFANSADRLSAVELLQEALIRGNTTTLEQFQQEMAANLGE